MSVVQPATAVYVTNTASPQPAMYFDDRMPKYLCCRQSCPVKAASITMAIFAIVAAIALIVFGIIAHNGSHSQQWHSGAYTAIFVASPIEIVTCIVLFGALWIRNQHLLVPIMAVLIGVAILCIYGLVMVCVEMFSDLHRFGSAYRWILLAICAATIIYNLWFSSTLFTCYRLFTDEKTFARRLALSRPAPPLVAQAPPPAIPSQSTAAPVPPPPYAPYPEDNCLGGSAMKTQASAPPMDLV